MLMKSIWLAAALAGLATAPLSAQSTMHMDHGDSAAPKTPTLLDGFGSGGFKITTTNPQAQAFFDNGMQLAHAIAHKAEIEAMTEAVRLDPKSAMCLRGQARTSGPTINFGKSEDEVAKLAEMADRAAELAKSNGTDRERVLIHALQLRYKNGGGGKDGDLNFAKAMAAMATQYPNDNEIAVMAADAWLMTHADSAEDWKLNARLAVPLLEGVLKRDPDYTRAIPFYLHATEMDGVPALA